MAKIGGTVPDLGSNAAHLRLIRRAIVSTVLRAVLLLEGAQVELIVTEAGEAVRDFVRLGLQLTGIFRAVRVGQACILCWENDVFVGGESVNRPGDHIAVRRLLASASRLTPGEAKQPGFTLKPQAKTPAARA
ncbi:oxidoreductase C-terminal domain-containing protein [Amycolatopsis jejuensis]|uniref:oxidoreductase C-terminal domain-containing protein n=1 Tax=Amycolatopsis jejuensis TaxID=330084 RepID=UPI000524B82A|nr:oxidoreductase C-terminal domain-containing protein [Amycolatopsis jejuensis]